MTATEHSTHKEAHMTAHMGRGTFGYTTYLRSTGDLGCEEDMVGQRMGRWDVRAALTHPRLSKFWTVLTKVLLVAGVASAVFGLVLVLQGRPEGYTETMGIVVAVHEDRSGSSSDYDTTIEVPLGGETLRFESEYGHRDAMGEQVAVFYDPQNPVTTFETGEDRLYDEWLWLGLGIVLVLAAGGSHWLSTGARPPPGGWSGA